MPIFRSLALFALLGVCVAAPWFYGAVQIHVQVWLFAVLALGLAAAACDAVVSRESIAVPGLFWVLCLAVTFGAAQLVPLPAGLHGRVSPGTAALWQMDQGVITRTPHASSLSLYPYETRYNLQLILAAMAGLWLANRCVRSRSERLAFVTAIIVNGGLLTTLGVTHYLTATQENVIYWTVKLSQGGSPFASFVNRNHAGGYLNLCLGLSFGALLWVRMAAMSSRSKSPTGPARQHSKIALVSAATGVTVTLLLGVVLSLSRSAVLGAAAGVAGLSVLLAGTKWRGWAAVPIVLLLLAVSAAIWFGRGEILVDRFQKVSTSEATGAGSRIAHWQDALRGARDFPLFGSGLGTYRYIYRRYERDFHPGWFYHAENQYLEALVEGGLIGLGLLLTAIGVAAFGFWQVLRDRTDHDTVPWVCAGAFALLSQMTQSLFDFGLYLPSNAVLFAAICGVALGAKPPPAEQLSHRWRIAGLAISVMLCVLLGISTWDLRERAVAHEQIKVAQLIDGEPETDPLSVDGSIAALRGVVFSQPRNAEASQELASSFTLAYQLAALDELRGSALPRRDLWSLTAPLVLHKRFHESQHDPQRLQSLRANGLVAAYLHPALSALRHSLVGCPLIPEARLALAELAWVDPEWTSASEESLLQTSVSLNPTDPDILFKAGLLDMHAGRTELGLQRWRQSLEHSTRYVSEATRFATELASIDEMMAWMLPSAPEPLVAMARQLNKSRYDAQRLEIADLAEKLLASESSALSHYLRAGIAELRGDVGTQIEQLRLAINGQPRNLDWRYELAELLLAQGALAEAHEHAVVCVRLAGHRAKYRLLLGVITERMHAAPPE